jgi:hypothetical protein
VIFQQRRGWSTDEMISPCWSLLFTKGWERTPRSCIHGSYHVTYIEVKAHWDNHNNVSFTCNSRRMLFEVARMV